MAKEDVGMPPIPPDAGNPLLQGLPPGWGPTEEDLIPTNAPKQGTQTAQKQHTTSQAPRNPFEELAGVSEGTAGYQPDLHELNPAWQQMKDNTPSVEGVDVHSEQEPRGTDASTLLGVAQFEWKGFIYQLGAVNIDIEGQYEQRCYRNEIIGIEQVAPYLNPVTYSHLINAYLNRLSSKFWRFRDPPSIDSRRTEEGLKDLFFLVLAYYNNPINNPLVECPPIKRKMMDDIWSNHAKWMELKKKIEVLTDPNPQAPNPPAQS